MRRLIFLSSILILGILLVSGCKRAPSSGGNIVGKVTEAGTGRPMANVEITVYSKEGLSMKTTTDDSGNYSLANIPAGSYKVSAFLQGYYLNETREEIQIERGKKKVDFQLVVVGGGT